MVAWEGRVTTLDACVLSKTTPCVARRSRCGVCAFRLPEKPVASNAQRVDRHEDDVGHGRTGGTP